MRLAPGSQPPDFDVRRRGLLIQPVAPGRSRAFTRRWLTEHRSWTETIAHGG